MWTNFLNETVYREVAAILALHDHGGNKYFRQERFTQDFQNAQQPAH